MKHIKSYNQRVLKTARVGVGKGFQSLSYQGLTAVASWMGRLRFRREEHGCTVITHWVPRCTLVEALLIREEKGADN